MGPVTIKSLPYLNFIPHRELSWLRALSHEAVDSGFEPPEGILGSILTRPVLRGPKGIMGMHKRIDHPLDIKKYKTKQNKIKNKKKMVDNSDLGSSDEEALKA